MVISERWVNSHSDKISGEVGHFSTEGGSKVNRR